jgi:hypothetical protein
VETECPSCDDLLRERDDLVARLAAVEAERDALPTWEQHRIWQEALRRENERRKAFEAEARDYRNAITWDTTCLACSKVLDSAYAETVRAETAEARLAAVRALCDVDDGDVVTRAEIRAVLAAVNDPAQGWPDEDAARFLDHERQQRAAVDPPADTYEPGDGEDFDRNAE